MTVSDETKLKILYIGPHNEYSDEGEICRGDISALAGNVDLATRSNGVNNYQDPTSPFNVPSYDNASLDNITHVIQYARPEIWERYGNYVHVGYLDITQDDISRENFVSNIQMMDEIWCPTQYACRLIERVCNTPVKFIPHHVDLDLYKKEYKISEIPEISGTYKFICVSNNTGNLEKVIESFLKEFDPTEPVSLIIKSHSGVNELIKSIKNKLQLYKIDAYQKIVLIDNQLSFVQMMGLYKYCDCYISELSLSPQTIAQTLPVRHCIGFYKSIIGFDSFDKIEHGMRCTYNRNGSMQTISNQYLFDKEFCGRVIEEINK